MNRSGVQSSEIARKPCGRCGIAVGENEFCPPCRDFFLELSRRKVVFVTVMRRTQKHWSGVSAK